MIVAEAAVLLRRSYLEDDVSSKSLLGWDDFSSSINVFLVRDGGSFSSTFFDDEVDSILLDDFLDGLGGDGDSSLICVDLFRDTDD